MLLLLPQLLLLELQLELLLPLELVVLPMVGLLQCMYQHLLRLLLLPQSHWVLLLML
jgi:hypothetical protein